MENQEIHPHWTETIPQGRVNWDESLENLPVVKLTQPSGSMEYAVCSPVFTDVVDRSTQFSKLHFQNVGKAAWSWDIPVELLRYGSFQNRIGEYTIEFDGFAGDQKHHEKQWSYFPRK
jgi:hypothetical protein